jgi:hypothetical protein
MRSTALIKTHLARTSRRTRNPGFGGGQSNLDVKVSRSLRPSAPKAIRLYVVIPKGWSTNAMPGRGFQIQCTGFERDSSGVRYSLAHAERLTSADLPLIDFTKRIASGAAFTNSVNEADTFSPATPVANRVHVVSRVGFTRSSG